jgi:hypothetical protein
MDYFRGLPAPLVGWVTKMFPHPGFDVGGIGFSINQNCNNYGICEAGFSKQQTLVLRAFGTEDSEKT